MTRQITGLLRRHTLRRQLEVSITVGILGIALCSFLVSSWQSTQRVRRDLIVQGERITDNLAHQSLLALLTASPENAAEAVATTLSFPGVIQVEIRRNDGQQLLARGTAQTWPARPRLDPAAEVALVQEAPEAWRFAAQVWSQPSGDSPFQVQPKQREHLGEVTVTMSKQALTQLTRDLLITNMLTSFSFVLLCLVLIRLLTKRATRPLDKLCSDMARAEAGENNVRATPAGPSDIAAMAHAFNHMMEALEEREAELLTARDRALEYGRLKAEFAATVSHEVRTPMNGVIGMLDILKSMKLPRQQREFVEVAWGSARALLELINDILDFSKLGAGKMALESIEFDLRQAVEETLELFAAQAHQKGLEIGYLMADEVPERLVGDPKRLRQVLANLLGNAVKFTEHGEIAVHLGFEAGEAAPLRIAVSDTGIGIDAQACARLFEPFAQADPSTTRKYGGSGLGLAIARQLVTLMGGRIGVDSEPGQGSRFWFALPTQASATVELREPWPALKLLVVDDSPIARAFLSHTLNAWDLHCEALHDGQHALDALRQANAHGHPYDVVIMDAAYAMLSEGQLARHIRYDDTLGHARVVVMDKLAAAVDDEAKSVGEIDAYLTKPLRRERLRACLRGLLADPALCVCEPVETVPCNERARRVLVVEDNRTNQAVATGMLATLGCQSTLASGGLEALDILRGEHFDLILMDCNMPGMDGYEVTACLRAKEETDGEGRRTPIVAMTANTRQVDVEKCLAAGMDDHLGKPFTLDNLSERIQRWTGWAATARHADEDMPGEAIDRAALARLREALGGALDLAVTPFLEDTPAVLEQIASALLAGDPQALAQYAHVLKGSAGNLGATRLAALARQLEEQATGAAPLLPAGDWIPRLRAEFEAAHATLASEPHPLRAAPPRPAHESALVLVVDDDRSTRAALRYTLQHAGLRVEEAGDGAEALALVERLHPDVVLMDGLMPVMDGFTACARLQEEMKTPPPVLIITALEDRAAISRAFSAGASDYITKPIHPGVVSQRVRRIIESSRAERHVRHLAYHDTLTGLANRAMFMDQLAQRLEHAREHGQMLAVLFLDLDRFKLVNDTLGHDIGDRLLVSVARRIRHCVRGSDTVARFGGDEFTILLEDLVNPATAAATAAGKICRALAAPFEVDGHDIFVSTSIGIATFPNDGDNAGTLLKHADTAMYRAKKHNTGHALYEAEMEASLSGHLHLHSALRRALTRDELSVVYQPKVDLATGAIHGMEALLRWRHPQLGMVPPNDFIPIAEETGLILPIGEWVLRTACEQAQAWNSPNRAALPVAVNLSGLQLRQGDFVDKVAAILDETGLAPELLELELTESMLMEQVDATLITLQRLKAQGIRLAIDDFGTGYSSLAYLKRFPVDTLKVDRSFVRDVTSDPDDAAIVTGIIALAHSLRLTVVAEGVETTAQRDFLQGCGCDSIQGYLIAEPLPPELFVSRLLTEGT